VLCRLSPREGAIPVPNALAQPAPLNTELSGVGGSALRAYVPFTASLLCLPHVLLGCRWEQDGLLTCAISSDDMVAMV
jgi:hypothetical protein